MVDYFTVRLSLSNISSLVKPAMPQPIFPFCTRSACKGTKNIWNTQGFWSKKSNLFGFFAQKTCYSHFYTELFVYVKNYL